MNNATLSLELLSLGYLEGMHINCVPLKKEEHITEITIGENIVIVHQDAYYEGGDNINAYDWQGNYLWNIADIVGIKGQKYSNSTIISFEELKENLEFDSKKEPEKYQQGHTLCFCTCEGNAYVIDLHDKQVLQVLHNQK